MSKSYSTVAEQYAPAPAEVPTHPIPLDAELLAQVSGGTEDVEYGPHGGW